MSVGSTGSDRSKEKVECPCCNVEFKQSSIFNHFYNKHNDQFLTRVKSILPRVDDEQPLELHWNTVSTSLDPDPEQELEISSVYYGCLECKKTFMSQERGMKHFKDAPSCREGHISEMKQLRKRFQERKEREKNRVSDAEWNSMKNNNHLFAIRGIWALILHMINAMEKTIIPALRTAEPGRVSAEVWGFPPSLRTLTVQELLELYNRVRNDLKDMEVDKVMDYEKLNTLSTKLWRICEAGPMVGFPILPNIVFNSVDEQLQPLNGVSLPASPF